MDQELDPERLASKSYWEITCERLSREAANGNENTLDGTIASFLRTTTEAIYYQPRDVDFEAHEFWFTVLLAAQNYDADNLKQDLLLRYILTVREMGALTRGGTERAAEKLHLAVASNGQRLWIDLPFLVQDFFQSWRADSMKMSTAQRRNLASFIARLASVGVCGDLLTGCALLLFRDTFETPRRLTSADPGPEVPVEDLLPAVDAWIEFAPYKLGDVVKKSFDEFGDADIATVQELARSGGVSEGGFNTLRWNFWKKRLAEIGQSGRVPKAFSVLNRIIGNEPDEFWC